MRAIAWSLTVLGILGLAFGRWSAHRQTAVFDVGGIRTGWVVWTPDPILVAAALIGIGLLVLSARRRTVPLSATRRMARRRDRMER